MTPKIKQSPLLQDTRPIVGESGFADGLFGAEYSTVLGGTRYTSDSLSRGRGWAVYERMLRDDQVASALVLGHSFVTALPWMIEIDDEDTQADARDLLLYNFSRALAGTVRELLEHLLTARIWGLAMVEKMVEPVPWRGAPRWMVTAFKLRPAWAWHFETDTHGNVLRAYQQTSRGPVPMPYRKFVHAVYQAGYDAQYGRSCLIPAYDRWWEKRNAEKMWDVYLERAATGFLFGTMPRGLSAPDAATLQQAMDRAQSAAAVLAPADTDLKYVSAGDISAYKDRVQNLDQAIARALLLPSHLGLSNQGSTGSKAQGTSQLELYENVVGGWAAWLEDVVNEQVVIPLVRWNFGTTVEPPLFKLGSIAAEQVYANIDAINRAIAGGVVQRTDEDEILVRAKLGLPPRDYGEEPEDAEPEPEPESNPLQGTARVQMALPMATVMARLDIPGSVTLLDGQDAALALALRDAARASYDALRLQVKPGTDPEHVRALAVPPAALVAPRKRLREILQTTYDQAAQGAQRVLADLGRAPAVALALTPDTAAAWIEANVDQLLGKLTETQRMAFVQAMLNGLQNDWSEGEIIQAIDEILGPDGVSTAWISTAVRTIDASAFNAARRAVFEDPTLGEFVIGYEYTGVLDSHTTEVCRAMQTADNGGPVRLPTDSPVWGRLFPPNHYNCRSTVIPLIIDDGDVEWSDPATVAGLAPMAGF